LKESVDKKPSAEITKHLLFQVKYIKIDLSARPNEGKRPNEKETY